MSVPFARMTKMSGSPAAARLGEGDPLPVGREGVGEDGRPRLEVRELPQAAAVRSDDVDLGLLAPLVGERKRISFPFGDQSGLSPASSDHGVIRR